MKEEKEIKKEEKQSGEVSRRDFLVGAGTVVVGGAIGATVLSGCGPAEGTKTVETTKTVEKTVTTTIQGAGGATVTKTETVGTGGATITKTTTITQPGGMSTEPADEPEELFFKKSCSDGRNAACVYVKHNRIVRISPLHFDMSYTREQLKPGVMTAKGKTFDLPMKSLLSFYFATYKKRVYSPNRILYPLKRVDWEPGGDPAKTNPQNRGKSKYKRVTWDWALNTVVSELKRINEKYSPWAVLTCMDIHGETKTIHNRHGSGDRLLRQNFGGYTQQMRDPDSWEGWYWGAKHFWGNGWMGQCKQVGPMYSDIARNSEMVICWGHDPATQVGCYFGQFPDLLYYWFQDVGIFILHISPDLNFSGQAHYRFGRGKWIPIICSRDDVLSLAISYTWIKEGTYDQDYLDTHSVGFDKHKEYVMGQVDGIEKTPEWASPLCGITPWTIKAIARQWHQKVTSTAHREGGPYRGPYTSEHARLEGYNMAMQGMGAPGRHSWATPHNSPRWERNFRAPAGFANGFTFSGWPGAEDPYIKQHISRCMIHRAILEGTPEHPVSWMGTSLLAAPVEDQFQRYYYPIPADQGGSIIHMIWTDSPCNTGCWNGGFHQIEAWRAPQIETTVGQHMWLENDMLLCDIILPENTKIEEEDIQATTDEFSFAWLMYEGRAVAPVGESMSQMEQCAAMADILGTKAEYMNNRLTVEEWLKYGFDNSNAQDLISYEDWKKVGYITSPPAADWQEDKAGLIDFYNDPKSDPIQLPSGLLEFYSQRLAEHFPDDRERWPCARYVEGGPESEGWSHDDNPFTSKRRDKYPLVCQTNHPRWRFHVQFDDVPWFREIESDKQVIDGYAYESLWLHPETAAARGIKHGDIVRMYNERGSVLYAAYVTQKVHPLVARSDHGARIDPMCTDGPESEWIDRGGSTNLITPINILSKNCTGHCVSGFLVEVEKVEPNKMEEWKQKYPDCFNRDYDPAYGTLFSAWIEKEGGA